MIEPSCFSTSMTRDQLRTFPELSKLLEQAKEALESVESREIMTADGKVPNRSASMKLRLDEAKTFRQFRGSNMSAKVFLGNGRSLIKFDDDNMWVKTPKLPEKINLFYLSKETITFVHDNGEVHMKPVACMSADEKQFVSEARADVLQARSNKVEF